MKRKNINDKDYFVEFGRGRHTFYTQAGTLEEVGNRIKQYIDQKYGVSNGRKRND